MNAKRWIFLFFVFLSVPWNVRIGQCEESKVEYHLLLGIKMFPALVGGNLDIESQKDSDGNLVLLVVSQKESRAGDRVSEKLRQSITAISKYPIRIKETTLFDFSAFATQPVAGIFLAEAPSSTQRTAIVHFGIQKKAVVFSPFDGDVQNGILSGLHIATQVQPAINLTTLRASGIRMNKLFLKVAKTYE